MLASLYMISSPSQVEIRETAWREAPYYGHAPPMMYRLLMHECDTANLFERYRKDCSKCPWGAIDKKVIDQWQQTTRVTTDTQNNQSSSDTSC